MTPHTCPTCAGTGKVSRPPHVAGDVDSWTDDGFRLYDCHSCSGTGILWRAAQPTKPGEGTL